jgi:hypothetical protein
MLNIRQIAELYIQHGWKLIPLVAGEKFPVAEASDYNNREFGVDDIKSNIGVKTGNQIVVIDIDINNTEKRKKFIHNICERSGLTLDALLFQTTASGRIHLIFKTDKEIQSIMRVPFEGEFIDLLGKGRYCVIYPSQARGKDGQVRRYMFFRINKAGNQIFIHPGQPGFFDAIPVISDQIITYLKELKFLSEPAQPKSDLPSAWEAVERIGLRMHRDRGYYRSYFCPFHKDGMEKEGSLMIRQDGAIMDFHNNKGYNLISFIMEYKRWSYQETLKWLEETFHIKLLNNKSNTQAEKKQEQIDGLTALEALNQQLPSPIKKLIRFTTSPISYRLVFENNMYIDFDNIDQLLSARRIRNAIGDLFVDLIRLNTQTWEAIVKYLFHNAVETKKVEQETDEEIIVNFMLEHLQHAGEELNAVRHSFIYHEPDKRFYFKWQTIEKALQADNITVKKSVVFKILKEKFNMGRTQKKIERLGIQDVYFVTEDDYRRHLKSDLEDDKKSF